MDYRKRITFDPARRGGKPCIRGLRITVYDLLDYLASGMTEQQILDDFPDLELEDIRAALAFSADMERRFVTAGPT
jgi:uncharacterized protein (DUF433 family)